MIRVFISLFLVQLIAWQPLLLQGSSNSYNPSQDQEESLVKPSAKLIENFQLGILNQEKTAIDPFQIFRQSVIAGKRQHPQLKSLQAELLDESFQSLETFDFRRTGFYKDQGSNSKHLRIYDGQGFSHYFHIQASQILWSKSQLFWVERDFAENSFLYWIDTRSLALGKSEVPIYRVPFTSQEQELKWENKKLMWGKETVSRKALLELRDSQDAIFQFYLNLLNPKRLFQSSEWLSEFYRAYDSHLAGMKDFNKRLIEPSILKSVHHLGALKSEVQDPAIQLDHRPMERMRGNVENQSKLLFKMKMLGIHLVSPNYKSISSWKEALLALAVSVETKNTALLKEALTNFSKQKNFSLYLLSASVTGVALYYPDAFLHWTESTAELMVDLVGRIYGNISDLATLGKESFVASFSGFHPEVFAEAYIFEGNWKKTVFGLSMLTGIMIISLGVPHILLNSWTLAREVKPGKLKSNFTRFKKSFIERQRRVEKNYVELLIKGDADSQPKSSHLRWKAENQWIKTYLNYVEKKDFPKTRFFLFMEKMRRSSSAHLAKEKVYEKNIDSFASALSHFLFSFASLTNSGHFFVRFWNTNFVIRAILLKPRVLPYIIIYPRFFKTALLSRDHGIHLPSKYNGGKDNLFEVFRQWWTGALKDGHRQTTTEQRNNLKNRARERTRIINIERQLEVLLIEKVQQSMMGLGFFKTQKVWPKEANSMTSRSWKSFSFKKRMYSYWLYQWSMEYFVVQLSESGYEKAREPKDYLERFLDQKMHQKAFTELSIKAKEKAEKSYFSWQNYWKNNEMKALRKLSPENSLAFERFADVKKQSRKPLAMARAVRSTVANIIVDRPIELVFLLFFVAGVDGDIVKPIHQEMNGPNSLFYLSKYQFFNGYLHGVITGFLYQTWMKLQYDARLDGTGVFSRVPDENFRSKSFRSFYLSNMRSEDNRWWQNQWYITKLAWANMGVATLSYTATQMMYLGRVDLDLYFAGYIMFFFSPFSGLYAMLENAFEKSAPWVIRDIPKAYRNHPYVVKYAERSQARLRFQYNLWFALFQNTSEYLMVNMRSMDSSVFGSRGFSRWLLSGYTFTGLANEAFDKTEEVAPILKKPVSFCRKIFTKNFTDW